jgi:hypothetical protein
MSTERDRSCPYRDHSCPYRENTYLIARIPRSTCEQTRLRTLAVRAPVARLFVPLFVFRPLLALMRARIATPSPPTVTARAASWTSWSTTATPTRTTTTAASRPPTRSRAARRPRRTSARRSSDRSSSFLRRAPTERADGAVPSRSFARPLRARTHSSAWGSIWTIAQTRHCGRKCLA